jgi:hypothetical protein
MSAQLEWRERLEVAPKQMHEAMTELITNKNYSEAERRLHYVGEELRAYYHACTTEESPPRLLVLLKKLDEETEPSAEQVG